MNGNPARALVSAPIAASTRSLSTARSVLRVLTLLVEKPSGVRADEVAESLGKSTSTAYYLLSSLCEEGFAVHGARGVYHPARGIEKLEAVTDPPVAVHDVLLGTVDELFAFTRRRSYLGVVRGGRIEIIAFCGRQGVPRMPGLGSEIRDNAHALAMGKVVLAQLDSTGLARYVGSGLRGFTPQTITSPKRLAADLERAREDGFAVDREEFDTNFCCIAAPIYDDAGRFVAALGLSVTASVFDAERDHLAEVVTEVAGRTTPAAAGRTSRRARLASVS